MPISTFKLIEHFGSLPDYEVHAVLPSGAGALTQRICSSRLRPCRDHRLSEKSGLCASVKSVIKFLFFLPGLFLKVRSYFRNNGIALVHFSDVIDFPFTRAPGCLQHGQSPRQIALENKNGAFSVCGTAQTISLTRTICIYPVH